MISKHWIPTKEFDYVLTMPNTETTVQLVSTVISKLALREAIANAETAMAGEEYATMIPSAKRNFDAAYAAAVAVEADKTALQDEIDEAWKNMLDAMFYLSLHRWRQRRHWRPCWISCRISTKRTSRRIAGRPMRRLLRTQKRS